MILHKQWGEIIRTGNFMFKYASLHGFSKKYDCELKFPQHYMFDYFKNSIQLDEGIIPDIQVPEIANYYTPEHFDKFANDFKNKNVNIALNCFLQSAKYWEHCEDYVIEKLQFKNELLDEIKNKYSKSFSKKTIGISIRRGDWIGHGFFWQIPTDFYMYALEKYFPNWNDYNIIFFSDDPDWIRNTFHGDNIYYSSGNFLNENYHNNPMEQLLYGSLCDNFIISNSTFSWWLAYLATNCKNSGTVVHTGKWMTTVAYHESKAEDYYHSKWITSDFFNIKDTYDFKKLSTNILLKG